MTEKTLFIFRHGETDWNRARRLQGSTDIPLNDLGRQQAESLREFFRSNPVEVFLSSDLVRAVETARIASSDLRVPLLLDARLRETNLGAAEGLTREEIVQKLGAETFAQWAEVHPPNPHFRFPNGESKAEHLARLVAGLEDNLREHPYSKWGVASHGGAMRRIIHHLAPGLEAPVMVGNGVVYELKFDESGLRLPHLSPRHVS